ncbi:MAG: pyridoxamine kinase [Defluviitaleaceae bacterium]|nr:pyridoxamine kinase [Defluviitaleaceae bacterium]
MDRQKRVCAIHDISCVGRCSLTVALPIISAAGMDCGILPTAVLSTHTGGFEGFTYRDLTADVMPISAHWQTLGLGFDALYSGFLGSFEQIDLVGELFDTYKTSENLVLVDPVMADNGKLYAIYSPEMAKGMAKLCGKADIIIPNITEACFMVDTEYKTEPYDKPYIENLLQKLGALGAKQVVLTGVSFNDSELGAAVYDVASGNIDYVFAPRIDGYFHGTGDCFGSALLSALLNGKTLTQAAQTACNFVHKSIEITLKLNQERRYGVAFELALPSLMKELGILNADH